MRVELQHVIAHPVGRVFAVVSDPESRPLWQENTSDVVMLTPPPTGFGTRWREMSRGLGAIAAEVVGFEDGVLWEEAGSAEGGTGRVSVRFRDDGAAATHLTVVVEIHLRGARRLMEPALGGVVSRQMPSDLGRLERLLDERV